MSIKHKYYNQHDAYVLPPSLDEMVAKDDPARVVSSIVDQLPSNFFDHLYSTNGCPSYNPFMMLKVVIYAYVNNVFSAEHMAKLIRKDLGFMWLIGPTREYPSGRTINRFRVRMKNDIRKVLSYVVLVLNDLGLLSLDKVYLDGTKIEAKSNRYTFVWKKSVERYKNQLEQKLQVMIEEIENGIADEIQRETDTATTPTIKQAPTVKDITKAIEKVDTYLESKEKPTNKEEQQKVRKLKQHRKQLKEGRNRLGKYNRQLEILGDRNSYSKTDHTATFMRPKRDQDNPNARPLPSYNVQITTNEQIVTAIVTTQNANDSPALPIIIEQYKEMYGKYPSVVVADAGYGSEENYTYLEDQDITAHVKYGTYDKEQKCNYQPNPYQQENFEYNAECDIAICPQGHKMQHCGTTTNTTRNKHEIIKEQYRIEDPSVCANCPVRDECFTPSEQYQGKVVAINHNLNRLRKKARNALQSEEGKADTLKRGTEPETVFGQWKYNMSYQRFRHTGQDKVEMDLGLLAIAHNMRKACTKLKERAVKFTHLAEILK